MTAKLLVLPLLLTLHGCTTDAVVDASECVNALSAQEQAEGWRLLFAGDSLEQWRSYDEDEVKADSNVNRESPFDEDTDTDDAPSPKRRKVCAVSPR